MDAVERDWRPLAPVSRDGCIRQQRDLEVACPQHGHRDCVLQELGLAERYAAVVGQVDLPFSVLIRNDSGPV
jgi:hypothetical protein